MITLFIIMFGIYLYILSIVAAIKLDDYLEKKASDISDKIPSIIFIIPLFNILVYLVLIFINFIEENIE